MSPKIKINHLNKQLKKLNDIFEIGTELRCSRDKEIWGKETRDMEIIKNKFQSVIESRERICPGALQDKANV